MKNRKAFLLAIFCFTIFLGACSASEEQPVESKSNDGLEISGEITAGLRVLSFDPFATEQNYRIYRGDYIVPEVKGSKKLHLVIPDLKVDQVYPVAEGEKKYFKVPATGVYKYEAGNLSGVIEAIDYTAATYSEVSALEAAELIKNRHPYILDVRTEREFKGGHIAGAKSIPVGVFQNRIDEIDVNKEDPIFIYCRSGNRSTVASRILINFGFKQVINLRHGLNDWSRQKLPLKR